MLHPQQQQVSWASSNKYGVLCSPSLPFIALFKIFGGTLGEYLTGGIFINSHCISIWYQPRVQDGIRRVWKGCGWLRVLVEQILF